MGCNFEEIKLWFLNYKGENVKILNFDTDEKAKDLIKQTSRYFKRFACSMELN